jgi:uncharacterized iron-regulated membrane protein
MKIFFRNIHLYLSLVSGFVIAIVCFTGAVLVFEKELKMAFHPERYTVEKGTERLPLQHLVTALQRQMPEVKVTSVKVYADPTRSVELSFKDPKAEGKSEGGKKEGKAGPGKEVDGKALAQAGAGHKEGGKGKGAGGKGGKGGGGKEASIQAFMDPYTGQFLGTYNNRESFFFTMFQLHRWLLAEDTGKLIVGISTVFFLFILVTGIVLWWPKNKKILKQRLKLKWDGGWKRLNHDLHIVIGFYTAIFLFVFAFTGLAWSFEWFNNAIYTVTGTENTRPEPPTTQAREAATLSLDQALAKAKAWEPAAEFISINSPKTPEDAISISVMPLDAVHERASNQLFLDPYTGEALGQQRFADKNLGQQVRATFYPVHVGSIAGLPGRIIAFLACIAGTTFPITGIILWVNRLLKNRRKEEGKKRKRAQALAG